MKFKDYTWDKEFEIKGYFSERSDSIVSKNSLSGTLHYSPREIVLELFGEFEEETGISFGFGKYLEKIYGYSSSGNILILNTYGEPMVHSSSPGFPITRYRVKNFKIYSVFYNELENSSSFVSNISSSPILFDISLFNAPLSISKNAHLVGLPKYPSFSSPSLYNVINTAK